MASTSYYPLSPPSLPSLRNGPQQAVASSSISCMVCPKAALLRSTRSNGMLPALQSSGLSSFRRTSYRSRVHGVQARAGHPPHSAVPPVGPKEAVVAASSQSPRVIDSFQAWLKEDHASTEFNRWLKARGINLPDYLGWLPEPLHEKLHYAEDEFFLLASEILLGLAAFLAWRKVKDVLRYAHWLWHHQIVKNRCKDALVPDFECTVFGALAGPIKASIVLMESSHLVTVFAPWVGCAIQEAKIATLRRTGFVILGFWFLLRWKEAWFKRAMVLQKGSKDQLVALDKLSTLVMSAVGILVVGETVGFAVKSLLALGGVSGIAVGLAARDVVGNLFGGTVIYITRPFTNGDGIKAGNISGQVIDIGFYSTKLLNSDRQPIYVPNAYFTNQVIINFSRQQNRVLTATFTLRHQDLPLVEDISSKICALLVGHPYLDTTKQAPSVWLTALSPLNLEISIQAVFKFVGGEEFNKARHEILIKSAQIIQKAGAAMSPYPPPPGPLVNSLPVTVSP